MHYQKTEASVVDTGRPSVRGIVNSALYSDTDDEVTQMMEATVSI